jgi:hypothetical protein
MAIQNHKQQMCKQLCSISFIKWLTLAYYNIKNCKIPCHIIVNFTNLFVSRRQNWVMINIHNKKKYYYITIIILNWSQAKIWDKDPMYSLQCISFKNLTMNILILYYSMPLLPHFSLHNHDHLHQPFYLFECSHFVWNTCRQKEILQFKVIIIWRDGSCKAEF